MHAYKLQVTVPAGHDLAIRLPDDFPPGPAEVIVLAVATPSAATSTANRTLEPHPVLGKIAFHEDRGAVGAGVTDDDACWEALKQQGLVTVGSKDLAAFEPIVLPGATRLSEMVIEDRE